MKRFLLSWMGVVCWTFLAATDPDSTATEPCHSDTLHCLSDFFSHGEVKGGFRNFLMSTVHPGALSNYWANGIGGQIHYESATYHGFSFDIKGIFIHNLASADLTTRDSIAGRGSRWERQLFDVQHPENRSDLDRLEELYLMYAYRGSWMKFGKMEIQTPLVNPHDERMQSYVVAGGWSHWQLNGAHALRAGWFSRVSPRAVTHWHPIADAIGIYRNGYDREGNRADYHGAISTRGVGLLGWEWTPGEVWDTHVWSYFLDQIHHTGLAQVEWSEHKLRLGGQYLRQDALPGGTEGSNGLYYEKDERANVLAGRLEFHDCGFRASLNVGAVFGGGRFIFPRELGREQFYVSIPRSRLEGTGNTQAVTTRFQWGFRKVPLLRFRADLGRFWLPDPVTERHFNKYALPSYDQFDLDVRYHFPQLLEGLEFRFLYVGRRTRGEYADEPSLTFNKSTFHHFNFITDIRF